MRPVKQMLMVLLQHPPHGHGIAKCVFSGVVDAGVERVANHDLRKGIDAAFYE